MNAPQRPLTLLKHWLFDTNVLEVCSGYVCRDGGYEMPCQIFFARLNEQTANIAQESFGDEMLLLERLVFKKNFGRDVISSCV